MPVPVAMQRQHLRGCLLLTLRWLNLYVLNVAGEGQAVVKRLRHWEVECEKQLGASMMSYR